MPDMESKSSTTSTTETFDIPQQLQNQGIATLCNRSPALVPATGVEANQHSPSRSASVGRTSYVLDNGGTHFVQGPYEVDIHAESASATLLPSVFTFSTLPESNISCPFDDNMGEILKGFRRQQTSGELMSELVGSERISLSAFFNRSTTDRSQPLSEAAVRLALTFPLLSTFAEKVALTYMVFLLMRWQISPTLDNYNQLPEWLSPRLCQILVPHPHWYDYIVFPRVREAQIQADNPVSFDDFMLSYSRTISVNWPHGEQSCVAPTPRSTSQHLSGASLTISPAFEAHIRDSSNWTLGRDFIDTLPQFAGLVRVKDQPVHGDELLRSVLHPWSGSG